jgi:hypothetical protein
MGRIVIACYRPKPEKRDALLWVLDVFGIRVAGEPHFRLRTVRYLAAAIVVARYRRHGACGSGLPHRERSPHGAVRPETAGEPTQ